MKRKLFLSFLLIAIVFTFSGIINAEVIYDKTEFRVEDKSRNYIKSGEDTYYNNWITNYKNKLRNKNKQLEIYTNEYKNNIDKWRNNKINIPSELRNEMKVIVGNIKGDRIQYTKNDIYNNELNLVKIKSIMEQGKINGMFVEEGKLFVTVKENSNDSSDLEKNNLLVNDIPLLFNSIYTSADYSIWQTIDPPKNSLDLDKYGIVRYGGAIENTHIGSVLFEADRVMKILANGYDNRTGEKIEDKDWYRSEWDYMPEIDVDSRSTEEEWHRYWFTIDKNAISVDPENKAVKISGDVLQIKTEKMEMVNGQLERSLQESTNDSQNKWVEHFNKNLDRYKKDYPVLKELEVLSRWSALLLALRESGIVFENIEIENIPTQKTPTKTSVIKIIKERKLKEETNNQVKTKKKSIILIGGVGFNEIETTITNLKDYKNRYLNIYNNNDLKVEKIF